LNGSVVVKRSILRGVEWKFVIFRAELCKSFYGVGGKHKQIARRRWQLRFRNGKQGKRIDVVTTPDGKSEGSN
jgi:hypothetical protein